MALLNDLLGAVLTSGGTQTIAEKSGTEKSQVEAVISGVLPILLKSMASNATSKEGAESLTKALDSHAQTKGTTEEQLKNADLSDGVKILSHILGGEKETVEKDLAKTAGVSTSQTETIIAAVAPLLLNQLGQQNKKEENAGGLGGLLGSLLGGDSAGGLGSILTNLVTGK